MSSWCTLVDMIKTHPRSKISTGMFTEDTQICLLDFVGASDFFITDFGMIWSRKKIYLNKQKKLTKNYLPMVMMDKTYHYPWVRLPLASTQMWFPVNMLLGWAFDNNDLKKQHYVSPYPDYWSFPLTEYTWEDINPEKMVRGPYYSFLKTIMNLPE